MNRLRQTPAAAIAAAFLLAASAVLANGCNAKDDSGNSSGGSSPEEAIRQLEESGEIPALNRSNDLAGPDKDKNGIRDDIDAYIAKQHYSDGQREAVQQLARAKQEEVTLRAATLEEAEPIDERAGRAIDCIWKEFPEMETAESVASTYHKLTANTAARTRSYLKYNALFNGTVATLTKGNPCDQ